MDEIAEIRKRAGLQESGAGPSRIVTHIQNGVPFVAISAERHERSGSENRRAMTALLHDIKQLGLSLIKTEGGFWENSFDGSKVPVEENSYFVMYRGSPERVQSFADKMIDLGKKYNQDGVLFGDGTSIFAIDTTGETPDYFRIGDAISFRANAVKDAPGFSTIKDRRWVAVGDEDDGIKYGSKRGETNAPAKMDQP